MNATALDVDDKNDEMRQSYVSARHFGAAHIPGLEDRRTN
jgi:hypothetical protein